MNEEVKALAGELNADSVKRGKDFKGYQVFEPVYKKKCFLGLPYVIFVKDEEARICTDSEALEYLDFVNESKGED